MELEADYLKPLSNQILNHFSMLLEIEKIGKENLDLYGLPESMLDQENWESHILSLLMVLALKKLL